MYKPTVFSIVWVSCSAFISLCTTLCISDLNCHKQKLPFQMEDLEFSLPEQSICRLFLIVWAYLMILAWFQSNTSWQAVVLLVQAETSSSWIDTRENSKTAAWSAATAPHCFVCKSQCGWHGCYDFHWGRNKSGECVSEFFKMRANINPLCCHTGIAAFFFLTVLHVLAYSGQQHQNQCKTLSKSLWSLQTKDACYHPHER